MDYRDYMGGQTYRLLEQTRQQMITGIIPKINQPAFEIAKLATPQLNAMDHLSKQTADLLGTTTMADAQLQEMMGGRLTAQAALQDLFPRPNFPSQLKASLDYGFKTPTIADYLAENNATSFFSFNEPTIAEQLGTQVDTKALMGLTGLADTAGKIVEQWRLANTGALSNFGESFNSLRAALNFNESLKSSPAARSFLFQARTLQDDQVRKFADTAPPEAAGEKLSNELAADDELFFVVKYVQNYFVSYLNLTPDQAQNTVKWILYLLLFGTFLVIHSQMGVAMNPTAELALEVGAIGAIERAGKTGSTALIPSRKNDKKD